MAAPSLLQAGAQHACSLSHRCLGEPRTGDGGVTLHRLKIKSEYLVSQCGSFLAIAASTTPMLACAAFVFPQEKTAKKSPGLSAPGQKVQRLVVSTWRCGIWRGLAAAR